MSSSDADRWNARYRAEGEVWLARSPRPLLRDHAYLLPRSGIALDAASGVGINSLFLAERGLHVIALDVSEVGLRMAQRAAKARGLHLDLAVINLLDSRLPSDCLDVILNFRFFGSGLIPQYRRALRPGGLLFFETFIRTTQDTSHPDHYLLPGKLRESFIDWKTMHWSTGKTSHRGAGSSRVTERLIVRKPVPR